MNTNKENIVYHYCDLSTALSILKTKQLRLTSIRNLNDTYEEIGIYKLFCKFLKEYDKEQRLNKFLELSDTSGCFQLYNNCLGAYPYYISCFSKEEDSVSQWNSYADNGNGVALGFDLSQFMLLQKEGILKCFDVNYLNDNDIKSEIPNIYSSLIMNIEHSEWSMMDRFMEIMHYKYGNPERYKLYHYESEKEFRIIYEYNNGGTKELNEWKIGEQEVYARRNCLNTYVPLSFPQEAIKSIMLGPMYRRNYCEIEFALEALGYIGIEIDESTSGFRTV